MAHSVANRRGQPFEKFAASIRLRSPRKMRGHSSTRPQPASAQNMNRLASTLWILAPSLLTPATLSAQRREATMEFQKRATTITYGAVEIGKHTLSDFPVDATWRLGKDQASTWRAEMPVVVGERILAPGTYRIQMRRIDKERCAIQIDGSALALGDGDELGLIGARTEAKRAAKKLTMQWRAGRIEKFTTVRGKTLPARQEAEMTIRFGASAWTGAVSLLGGEDRKVGNCQLTIFAVPVKLLQRHRKQPIPIATVTTGRGKRLQELQIVLEAGNAVVRPWMQAPTEENGFGDVAAPDAASTTSRIVEWSAAPSARNGGVLRLLGATLEARQMKVSLICGKQLMKTTFVLPETFGKATGAKVR
ncbi:MAG: hypothetical protein AB8H80_07275 [Planctomycetota bacterium]